MSLIFKSSCEEPLIGSSDQVRRTCRHTQPKAHAWQVPGRFVISLEHVQATNARKQTSTSMSQVQPHADHNPETVFARHTMLKEVQRPERTNKGHN